jgi:hypothetical protein
MHRKTQREIAAHLLRPILDSPFSNHATNSLSVAFERTGVPAIQLAESGWGFESRASECF